ncbi:MAG TPA: O-antigen ligase family protein, partial [Granulicella sp.]
MQLLSLPALVGFYFAARFSLTYLFFQADPQQGAIVGTALNLALLVVAVFYSFGPSSLTLKWMLHARPFRWVLVFLGFSLCSLLWSETVSVVTALVYWSALAADVAIVVLLLRTGPIDQRAAILIKGFVCGACFIACAMWVSPTLQDLRPGNDDFFTPNAIGYICAIGVFLAQFLGRSERIWRWLAVFLAVSLLRTLSKTTIAAFVAGELLLLFRDTTIRRRSKVLIVLSALLVIVAFWGLIADYYVVYTNAGNQAETLTGRIGIWAFVLNRALDRPWFGHGFHSFWNVIPPFGNFEAWHAHNDAVQQFYTYGVAGIVLLVGLYGSLYRQLRRVSSPPIKTLFLSLLLFFVVRGFA